jgi:hypothetical protein
MSKTKTIALMGMMLFGIGAFATGAFASGRDVGNGGDSYSLQFVKIGHDLESWIASKKGATDFPAELDEKSFVNTVNTTRVESTDEALSLNGIPKDAINYPAEKRIVFNRAAWDKLKTYQQRASLVMHEYLGIMGLDDSSYRISSYFLSFKNAVIHPANCTMRITLDNVSNNVSDQIKQIVKEKGYIDQEGPGYTGNGHWDFGKDGYLWIKMRVDYQGWIPFPLTNKLEITHYEYSPMYHSGEEPVHTEVFYQDSLSVIGQSDEQASQRMLQMANAIPLCE